VFATEYVGEETAMAEFREFVADVAPGHANPETVVDDANVDKYDFESGYYDRAWVQNCLAIGNAQGFVETLQSTALTVNVSLAVRFANLLSLHGRIADGAIRAAFNESVRRTWSSSTTSSASTTSTRLETRNFPTSGQFGSLTPGRTLRTSIRRTTRSC